ncbi:condensation domain-containing protein [Actinacidiphila glaucinigra]|uniref:condensation domain-containing protein n=1 Tax=Actinacidiphila glaucinigra TaxID=235986 RepID=UPI003D8BA5EC
MRRRLSPYERVIWAAGERLPVNIAAVARVEGRTTPERVRAAVAAVRRRHPLLGVRVADPGWWQGRLTTAGVPDPAVRVVRDGDAGAWSRVVEEELPRPFDTRTGPLARFVLVDAGEAFDLVTVYHHLVADAVSAGVVMRDLLTRLGCPDPADAPPPGPALTAGAHRRAGADGSGAGPVPVLAAPADELIPGPRVRPGDLLKTARALGGPVRPPYPRTDGSPTARGRWSARRRSCCSSGAGRRARRCRPPCARPSHGPPRPAAAPPGSRSPRTCAGCSNRRPGRPWACTRRASSSPWTARRTTCGRPRAMPGPGSTPGSPRRSCGRSYASSGWPRSSRTAPSAPCCGAASRAAPGSTCP